MNQEILAQSKTIQNQLIKIISDQILEGIITKAQTAKFFAVSADEATDRGLQTQLTMTLQYVDDLGNYRSSKNLLFFFYVSLNRSR